MTQRATCWSVTINNPTEEDLKVELPAGWSLTGQKEVGAEGTEHYQGMLRTPQVRFAAVKKVMKRAHIEVARNPRALEKYVHKADTRTEEVADRVSSIPTLFEYQDIIAALWRWDEYNELVEAPANSFTNQNELAMRYVDSLVAYDIETNSRRGAEFIGINPMWRSSWKLFWRSIIHRHASSHQTVHETPASGEHGSQASEASGNEERG